MNKRPRESPNFLYRVYGLILSSCIECPELMPAEGKPDVNVDFGSVPDSISLPRASGECHQVRPDLFLLKIPGTAKYLVENGRSILIDSAAQGAPEEIRLFLLGSAMGALLHQREMLPLHASAVSIGKKSLLFCGFSGAGKSTMASRFIRQGYQLLADDISVISLDDKETPFVAPGYPQLKLPMDAIDEGKPGSSIYQRIREGEEKVAVPVPNHFSPEQHPLQKIYILSPYQGNRVEFVPLSGMEKIQALNNHTYRFPLIEGLGKMQAHFKNTGITGEKVPVSRLLRPEAPVSPPDLIEEIEKDLSLERK